MGVCGDGVGRLLDEEFFGGGAGGGVDAEEVGAAGPGGEVEGEGVVAEPLEGAVVAAAEDEGAGGVVGLDGGDAIGGEEGDLVDRGVGADGEVRGER